VQTASEELTVVPIDSATKTATETMAEAEIKAFVQNLPEALG